MTLKCKICGISESHTLDFILNHKFPPEFIGFIVNYPASKRFVQTDKLNNLLNVKKKTSNFVAVLVKPNIEILEKIKDLKFDYYQIYDCTPEEIKVIREKYKKKIIAAITVENKEDVEKYKQFVSLSDIILFDSKGYEKSLSYNHNFIDNISGDFNIMIAGNIQINDIFIFKNKNYIIDISGGLEDTEGKKCISKINDFLIKVKTL